MNCPRVTFAAELDNKSLLVMNYVTLRDLLN